LYIQLSEAPVVENDEIEPSIIIDYDAEDNPVDIDIEILYFVKKHKNKLFPAFKAVESAV
jgi:hypothetical protein